MPLHETEAAFFYTIVCRKAAGGRFSVCAADKVYQALISLRYR